MRLTPGDRLGPYHVVTTLGVGGMGVVYRARDTRLNRDVALKTLSDAFAEDAERLARFTREAQVLASLNHPHIAAIYGLEDVPVDAVAGRLRALVLELVEGPTLADRIAWGTGQVWDMTPDAQRFLVAVVTSAPRPSPVTVLANWPARLTR